MKLCMICKENQTDEEIWFHNEPLPLPICRECQKKLKKFMV